MRLCRSYTDQNSRGERISSCRVTDEHGHVIEGVTRVEFTMVAGEMLPRLTISVLPARVELAGHGNVIEDAPPAHL